MEIVNNIKDTALIFEGGGMRASYTAGILNILLENEIYFNYVAGVSAGASHLVNYLSRDTKRAKKSFVDIVLDPKFGGWKSFFKGEGFFNAKYLYEETAYPDALLPFDFETFMANPAEFRIGAFNCNNGRLEYFTKKDIHCPEDLMKIVRSSSSYPILMPKTFYKGNCYIDGGIVGGIPLDIAKRDNMKKFFVILTHQKGYRREPLKFKGFLKAYYRKYPAVLETMLKRHINYNQTLDELEELERKGQAFLVYPETMPVSREETDYDRLEESYRLGYAQGKKDLHLWKNFLEGNTYETRQI
ncbi:MAG: patatin family protein [Clostridiales bacterium]|nr:patatin family protein [Clostridiales bacterium]